MGQSGLNESKWAQRTAVSLPLTVLLAMELFKRYFTKKDPKKKKYYNIKRVLLTQGSETTYLTVLEQC